MPITIDKIMAVVLCVLVIFLGSMRIDSSNQDAMTQAYVYSVTTEFVQEVQLNGYISQDSYNTFMSNLGNTGLLFDVEMTHAHDVVSPQFNADGNAVVGTSTATYTKYEDEILSGLYDTDGIYKFEEEDYFTVTVRNRSRTLAQKLGQMLTKSSTKYAIVATYGGTIRNEKY